MSKSENLYSAARELIPGGVNSLFAPSLAWAAPRCLSKKRTARICTMSMAKHISTMSVPGGQWYWGITIRLSAMR